MAGENQVSSSADACGPKLKLYKVVDTEEEREVYRQWARDNYEPFTPIDGVWHWLVQEECIKINRNTDLPWEKPWDKEGNPL